MVFVCYCLLRRRWSVATHKYIEDLWNSPEGGQVVENDIGLLVDTVARERA
jgi:hypothetical protein